MIELKHPLLIDFPYPCADFVTGSLLFIPRKYNKDIMSAVNTAAKQG